ncbi:MAG TPA: hypothetical protein VFK37_09050 [Bacillales bacterium]|nr:hypothetical protein [Bacillales bacterium]
MHFKNLTTKMMSRIGRVYLKRLKYQRKKVAVCQKDCDLIIKAHEALEEDMEHEMRRLNKLNGLVTQKLENLNRAKKAREEEMIQRVLNVEPERSFQLLFVFLLEDHWPCNQEWLVVYLVHGQLARIRLTTWPTTRHELCETLSKVHSKAGILALDQRSNVLPLN